MISPTDAPVSIRKAYPNLTMDRVSEVVCYYYKGELTSLVHFRQQ